MNDFFLSQMVLILLVLLFKLLQATINQIMVTKTKKKKLHIIGNELREYVCETTEIVWIGVL